MLRRILACGALAATILSYAVCPGYTGIDQSAVDEVVSMYHIAPERAAAYLTIRLEAYVTGTAEQLLPRGALAVHTVLFNTIAGRYLKVAQFLDEGSAIMRAVGSSVSPDDTDRSNTAARDWALRAPAALQEEAIASDALAVWFGDYAHIFCDKQSPGFSARTCTEQVDFARDTIDRATKLFAALSISIRELQGAIKNGT